MGVFVDFCKAFDSIYLGADTLAPYLLVIFVDFIMRKAKITERTGTASRGTYN